MQEQQLQNKISEELYKDPFDLLCQLIQTPSFSKEENTTALQIQNFFEQRGVATHKHLNNVWAKNKFYNKSKPTFLLNSHHDTVKPNKGYTLDPFLPIQKNGKLFGLGSNDAGGALVSLMATFLHFYNEPDLKYNIIFAASAEEEISGIKGIEALLPHLGKIEFGIVGEPTLMNLAIAEKGLMVLDCMNYGKAGHAAREEGDNAIYHALKDMEWFKNYQFAKISPLLGSVKMSVTSVETENKAHNIIPSECKFVVDVRANELYSLEEILSEIKQHVTCEIKPRSLRIRPSSINMEHPLVKSGIKLGRSLYGSPTTSDKALMNFPTLKIGPGDSARSHTADEFIYVDEIKEGIELYTKLINEIIY
ncbi:MAG: M20 family metallo-hydrolase [Bacteroidota bacterium]|nr:M20 family metallo-hydrolase [Bacteroidota bacterium]